MGANRPPSVSVAKGSMVSSVLVGKDVFPMAEHEASKFAPKMHIFIFATCVLAIGVQSKRSLGAMADDAYLETQAISNVVDG
uniref:Uncharacterized protein n=1 Tax=Oryza meridionalis TaxID=40149 RepID=A0A0E0C2N4_9ORYZ